MLDCDIFTADMKEFLPSGPETGDDGDERDVTVAGKKHVGLRRGNGVSYVQDGTSVRDGVRDLFSSMTWTEIKARRS
jgi:hypothetical protein